MNYQSAADVPLLVIVPSSTTALSSVSSSSSAASKPQLQAERRINPSWTIAQLKTKLEHVTGIPPGYQRLRLRAGDGSWLSVSPPVSSNAGVLEQAADGGDGGSEEERQIGEWQLRRGGELEVQDSRPPAQRLDHLYSLVGSSDGDGHSSAPDQAEKYVMPTSEYEKLPDSVLAWKRRERLGRFDPDKANETEERRARDQSMIERKGCEIGRRCRVGGDNINGGPSSGISTSNMVKNAVDDGGRRGEIRFVGEIEGLGGDKEKGAQWIGIELDEPRGKNDGSVMVTKAATSPTAKKSAQGENVEEDDDDEDDHRRTSTVAKNDHAKPECSKQRVRLFECKPGFGLLVRPDKVDVGAEWKPLDDLELDEDLEEL